MDPPSSANTASEAEYVPLRQPRHLEPADRREAQLDQAIGTLAIALPPPPQPEDPLPEPQAGAMVLRPTTEEAWALVEAELIRIRDLQREYLRRAPGVFEEFDRFLQAYGEEGRRRAARMLPGVERERALLHLRNQEAARITALQQAEAREAEAEAEAAAFRRRTEQEAAAIQERLTAARTARAAATGTQVPIRFCYVCGMRGVARGRECPNRVNHPGYVPRQNR